MSGAIKHGNEVIRHGLDHLAERASELKAEVKPKLRGWLHLGIAPLTLAGGIVLIALSPNTVTRVGSALFTGTAVILFTVSAIYHRGTWSPRVWAFLRRFDHSNIFLLIAGSYTPFSLLLLEGTERVVLLTVVWSGAVLGVLFRVFWAGAPRWLYLPIYLALGWAAVFFIPSFAHGAQDLGVGIGTAVLVLVLVGGGLYTIGGLVYGFKRPDPWPSWFGFHEIFHTFTILAFVSHYIGVSLATYSLR
jgi:hemolysin III